MWLIYVAHLSLVIQTDEGGVPTHNGTDSSTTEAAFTDVSANQATFLRSVSISVSHPTIWFQVGMLWDANIFNHHKKSSPA